jgi:serine/threonine-protein kinase/endoribonuclease IRE1
MALVLSLLILLPLLCALGTATPYLDFTLGLSRNVGTGSGTRIRGDPNNELSLARQTPRLGSISNRIQEGDELLDVVLLATIDGKFHALNRTDGTILWSMHNSFTTDCAVGEQEKSLSPLIRTPHVLPSLSPGEGEGNSEDEDGKIYIVEPQSGSIYVLPPHATQSTPISKLSFTVPQLVDMAPAAFPGEETRMFVGRKETSLIAIDLDTGVVKGVVDTDRECLWEPVLGGSKEGDGVDDPEDNPQLRRKREVYVGRTGELL